jgi:two-component system, cell cycle sensor histidine kinase and response regulator CckA
VVAKRLKALMRSMQKTVLIVDDEAGVIDVIREILEDRFRVLSASTYDQVFSDHFHDIQLALLDVALPGANGIELAKRLLTISPTLRVLFMSAQSGAAVFRYHGMHVTDKHFLPKPFDQTTLLKRVRNILKSKRSLFNSAQSPSIAATGGERS